jgi:hypothetical protein
MGDRLQEYDELVEQYHALDEKIDALLTQYNGYTKNMPPEAIQQYRELARRRDDIFNEMRVMERTLFSED